MNEPISTTSPPTADLSTSCPRHHHYLVFNWLRDLAEAGEGAWARIGGDSMELVVCGSAIDPRPVATVAEHKPTNEIVSIHAEGDNVDMAIQLDNAIHKSIRNVEESVRLLRLDAAYTQERLRAA